MTFELDLDGDAAEFEFACGEDKVAGGVGSFGGLAERDGCGGGDGIGWLLDSSEPIFSSFPLRESQATTWVES